MSDLVTIKQFCRIRYADKLKDGEPTKSQQSTVAYLCRAGKFKRAFKIGKTWLIDLEAEGE